MKEWILQNLDAGVIIAACSALGSVAAAITGLVSFLKARKYSRYVEEARKRQVWCSCPHCKKTIYLDQLKFRLPTGEIDDNLNGIPDDKE